MSLDLTVAIPTYNGAERLPLLLDRLGQQINPDSIAWEIIVVDNNSSDGTRQIVDAYQASGTLPVPLHYYFEPEQGAAFARQLAVHHAQGDWIGFLDDDNLPAIDWLAVAFDFAKSNPKMAAFSGHIHGEFEVEPPPGFEKIQAFLAIRYHGEQLYRFDPDHLILPPAASLVIRRQAWLDQVPKRPTLGGKRPGILIQGDDYEPLLYLHKGGWEIWYTPNLKTYHQIPRQRLEREYLLVLAQGCGLATCQLRMINAAAWQKPVVLIRTFLGNSRRILLQLMKYRGQLKTDLIPAVELSFFWGSLMSPWIYLKKQLDIDSRLPNSRV